MTGPTGGESTPDQERRYALLALVDALTLQ
jgi:hypothetical protein